MDKAEIQVALNKKLDAAWAEYQERLCGYSPDIIFNRAREIAATEQVNHELQNDDYSADLLEYFLRFENPLEVIRDQWLTHNNVSVDEEMSHAMWQLMDSGDAEQMYDLDPEFMPQEDVIDSSDMPEEPKDSLKTFKLYYPAIVTHYEKDYYGDLEDESTEMDHSQSARYLNDILARIVHEQAEDEMERGLMAYYHDNDSVNEKIISARPSAEVVDGALYGVAICRIKGTLSTDELAKFKDYWTGQMSDGYGDGFEQREIRCGDGNEIYVSFWSPSDEWSIQTKDEMRAALHHELSPMTIDRFWSIVEKSGTKRDQNGSIEKPLRQELQKLSPQEILYFDAIFREYHSIADTWLMWSAANLVARNLTDDGFIDFRAGLIGQGRKTYEEVIQNPDDLAFVDSGGIWCDESVQYAASTAYDAVRPPDSPDYYHIQDEIALPDDVIMEIQNSVQPHPQMGRRVESAKDAEELIPQCAAIFAAPAHNYNTWTYPMDHYDNGPELT